MVQNRSASFFTLGLLLLGACSATIDKRVDPDSPDEVGGAVLQSQDIRTMAQNMARDIGSSGILTSTANNQTVTFHIIGMENQSSDVINREIVLSKLETELFKAFGNRGDVLGSDYVLYGVIRDRVQQSGTLKSAYYAVTFTLTDLETDRKVWQNEYETKFLSEKSVISR
jgi:hypothetical protein